MKINLNSQFIAMFYFTAALCSELYCGVNTAYCAETSVSTSASASASGSAIRPATTSANAANASNSAPVTPASPVTPATPATSTSTSVKQSFQIKPLAGSLDMAPLFNSNSPEIVLNPGILLSTLSPTNSRGGGGTMDFVDAHLNYRFKKDFGVFLHHISKQDLPLQTDKRLLKLSLVGYNPGHKAIKLQTLARASFLSQPDAPFVPLPPLVSVLDAVNITPDSPVVGPVSPYAGPGDRVTWEFLCEKAKVENAKQDNGNLEVANLKVADPKDANPKDYELKDANELVIQPGQYQLIEEIPVPVKHLRPALNGRSYLGHFHSSGPIELALLARFDQDGESLATGANIDYAQILKSSDIVHPRESDKNYPSAPGRKGPLIYGRVAGVSKGLTFSGRISAKVTAHKALNLAYPVSSLERGTFGTKQIQAAPMIRRYRGSAYRAQGNYGVGYKIKIKLSNSDKVARQVNISLSCPLKEDLKKQNTLTFLNPPATNVFFRGTVMLRERPIGAREFFHLVMHKGELMPVLKVVNLEPYQSKNFEFEMFYPPDATPPQMLLLQSDLP